MMACVNHDASKGVRSDRVKSQDVHTRALLVHLTSSHLFHAIQRQMELDVCHPDHAYVFTSALCHHMSGLTLLAFTSLFSRLLRTLSAEADQNLRTVWPACKM